MLYKEIIAVCSQIHTKHINALCEQNIESFNVKLVVHIVTTGLQRVKYVIKTSQLMLYWEIIAVFFFRMLNLVVYMVTIGF